MQNESGREIFPIDLFLQYLEVILWLGTFIRLFKKVFFIQRNSNLKTCASQFLDITDLNFLPV